MMTLIKFKYSLERGYEERLVKNFRMTKLHDQRFKLGFNHIFIFLKYLEGRGSPKGATLSAN